MGEFTLKNGATVMDRQGVVVLALQERQSGKAFATWVVDKEGAAYHGHYFTDFSEAAADYRARCSLNISQTL